MTGAHRVAGAHRRTPPPCPAWCEVSPHAAPMDDNVVVHRTAPAWVTSISVSIMQIWGPLYGELQPVVQVARIGSHRSLQLRTADEVRALAELFDTTNGALKVRRALYEAADQFDQIIAETFGRTP